MSEEEGGALHPSRLGILGGVIALPEGGYVATCAYCHNAFKVAPLATCDWCRDKRKPAHGRHAMCLACRDIYRLLSQDRVDLVIAKYGYIPPRISWKVDIEKGTGERVGPSGEG